MIHLEKATLEQFDAVVAFYDEVMEKTPGIDRLAQWKKGAHPTDDGIRDLIRKGDLYLYQEGETIVGAMAFPMFQGPDYHAVVWDEQLPDDQVATIHLFAVHPDRQGAGIGSAMIRAAIALAYANGMKSVRLDVLKSNEPAQRLYESLGFEYRGMQNLYAENTGWIDFYFYEYKG